MNLGTEEQIIAAIAGAVVGLLVGFFTGRRLAPGSQETRELEQKLEDARAASDRFEQQVSAHFAETAGKLNTLTENYRDVYAHLARGASELCSPQEDGPRFDALAAPRADAPKTIEADDVILEPPRDYAPKASPNEPGVLNESFGLDPKDQPPEDSSTRS